MLIVRKNLEFENLDKKKPGKTWNFEQKSLKNQEIPGILNNFYKFCSKILLCHKKSFL